MARDYEIAGFGWHQGWQDGCAQPMANEYETNMVNFIKDIRKDLGVPNLPFVIGGSGFGGWEQKVARRLKISAAQQAAAAARGIQGQRAATSRPARFSGPGRSHPTASATTGTAMPRPTT